MLYRDVDIIDCLCSQIQKVNYARDSAVDRESAAYDKLVFAVVSTRACGDVRQEERIAWFEKHAFVVKKRAYLSPKRACLHSGY